MISPPVIPPSTIINTLSRERHQPVIQGITSPLLWPFPALLI